MPTKAEPPHTEARKVDVRLDLVGKAMLIRGVEQRLLELFAQGKLFGTVHTCIGQEWSGVAIAEALAPGDLIFTNHRGHGHYLARTDDVNGLIGEVMGKVTGMCGGRGGSQHMCSQGVFSNGIQGGIVPVSAGLAFAQKLRAQGAISVVFIGDGTLGEGALYESLNIASKWELPLLIVLENNSYAQSTSQKQTLAGDICARAEAFGIRTFAASTWDVPHLLTTAASAAGFVRKSQVPAFLRIDTDRLMAHSKGDDNRDIAEVKGYWARDAITLFASEKPAEAAALQEQIKARIDAAVAASTDAPYTPATTPDAHTPAPTPVWTRTKIDGSERVVNVIHAALKRNMERDPRIVLIGEDIEGPYGGAFKVTKNLSQEFPGRVRNTPISEAAIVGLGNGLALNGMLPVCEIMFGDFLALAADQLLNHASKFRYMYNDQVSMPLIVRTPMGGKRGYGPTHSQSIEKHFLGLPGTTMLALHHRFDPGLVYDTLLTTIKEPTIVIENKMLYGATVGSESPAGFVWEHDGEPFPTSRLRPEASPDLTVLCYGGMLADVEKAVESLFDTHEIVCEIICPTQLYPLNPAPIIQSVHRSGRLLIVEEGLAFAAFGAEAISQIVEQSPGSLQRVRRVASPRHPIPSSGPLEKALLPSTGHVVAAAVEMMRDV
ncbi:MAG: dehydrogenase E1 component subunit alpha/beta [Phycisphaerales bacterium]